MCAKNQNPMFGIFRRQLELPIKKVFIRTIIKQQMKLLFNSAHFKIKSVKQRANEGRLLNLLT